MPSAPLPAFAVADPAADLSRNAALLRAAADVYEAPVRIAEHDGLLEVYVAGRLMLAAFSMRGHAAEMLLDLLR